MAHANAHAVLAQLMQITVNVAAETSAQSAAQKLAAGLTQLFKADRVLVLDNKRGKALKLFATDSYSEAPPASAYTDELSKQASTLQQQFGSAAGHVNHQAWLPLSARFSLCLQRPENMVWQTAELDLLKQVAPAFAAGLRPADGNSRRRIWLVAAAIALLCMPVPDQVVAPATVESAQADVMFAPLEGIIESVVATPGSVVKAGDVLLKYQQRDWLQQHRQAMRDKELAESELVRLRAASWQDSQARAAVPAQELRIAQADQQVQYLDKLLAQTEVVAAQAGVFQLDDAEALEGALVRAGQKLMSVANPSELRLKLDVPVADFGKLSAPASLTFRSDANPWQAHDGELARLGADVYVSEQQRPSLPAWSGLESDELALGERGTARISTGWTLLAVAILKKPWQLMRKVLPGQL